LRFRVLAAFLRNCAVSTAWGTCATLPRESVVASIVRLERGAVRRNRLSPGARIKRAGLDDEEANMLRWLEAKEA